MTNELKNLLDVKLAKYEKGLTYLSDMRKNIKVSNYIMQL